MATTSLLPYPMPATFCPPLLPLPSIAPIPPMDTTSTSTSTTALKVTTIRPLPLQILELVSDAAVVLVMGMARTPALLNSRVKIPLGKTHWFAGLWALKPVAPKEFPNPRIASRALQDPKDRAADKWRRLPVLLALHALHAPPVLQPTKIFLTPAMAASGAAEPQDPVQK